MRSVAIIIFTLTISIFLLGCIGGRNIDLDIPLPTTPNPFEHPRLGWMLNKTYYIYETQGIDAARSFIASNPYNIVEGDSIGLRIIVKEINQTNLNVLKSLGINVTFVSSDETHIGAFVPIPKILDMGKLEFIKVIYPDAKPQYA